MKSKRFWVHATQLEATAKVVFPLTKLLFEYRRSDTETTKSHRGQGANRIAYTNYCISKKQRKRESAENEEQPQNEDIHQLSTEQSIATSAESKSSLALAPCVKEESFLCGGCNKAINDALVLYVEELYWHPQCLKCCECNVSLQERKSCYVRNRKIYCQEDYKNLFSQTCMRCGVVIQSHENVMRVRDWFYHATECCFCCYQCERPLIAGERFVVESGSLLCWNCLQPYLSSNDEVTLQKPGRPRKRKQNATSQRSLSHLPINLNFDEELHSAHERQDYETQKSKRVRTSFKHHQLCAMKAYFDSNHNPDAKDLKQLAQETGLTKRVLQVWFQNARAKFRRNGLQDENKSVEPSGSKIQPESSKSNSCLDLSCSDSVSSIFDESPVSESASEENRRFYENPDSDPMASYSDYHQSECLNSQMEENTKCSLPSFHTSSTTPSLTSTIL